MPSSRAPRVSPRSRGGERKTIQGSLLGPRLRLRPPTVQPMAQRHLREPSSKPACDSLPCSPESQARHAMHVLLPVPVGDRRHCPRHTQRHRRHTLPERQGPNAPIRNPSSTRMRSVPAQNRPRRPHADSHPKRRVHHPAVSRANTLAADATRTRDPRGDRLSRGRGPGDHTALHHPWRSHRALESERPKKRHDLP